MNNTTVAGLISLLIICGLLAFQFVEFEAVENAESSSLSESIYPKLLEEIKSIKSDLHDLHLSFQESPPEALTREALTGKALKSVKIIGMKITFKKAPKRCNSCRIGRIPKQPS